MPSYTTGVIGEEEPIVTSHAVGEEETHTTDALGEEGPYEELVSTSDPFGAF